MPGLCNDAEGVDRVQVHRDLVTEASRFFNHTLGRESRAGLQTADQ